jgi:hypothetical protein
VFGLPAAVYRGCLTAAGAGRVCKWTILQQPPRLRRSNISGAPSYSFCNGSRICLMSTLNLNLKIKIRIKNPTESVNGYLFQEPAEDQPLPSLMVYLPNRSRHGNAARNRID